MKTQTITKKNLGGVSMPKIAIPIAIVLAILHALIIVVIMIIGGSSAQMTTLITDYQEHSDEVSGILRRSSVMSETASTFCMNPTMGGGAETNVGPLMAYLEYYHNEDLDAHTVVVHFREYDVSENIKSTIATASNFVDKMIIAQSHAIALVTYDHPLPENPPVLKTLPQYDISEYEKSLTPEARANLAYNLLHETEYSGNKDQANQNVTAAVAALRTEMKEKSAEQLKMFSTVRAILWAVTMSVIVLLILTFFFFLQQLLLPLTKFAHGITTGEKINDKKGMSEVRLLAATYNDLLRQKERLEKSLRLAAETDILTHLPNRFCFENHFLAKVDESGYSAAIFFFDINYLKAINDSLGHSAGDALLVNAARTITACFLQGDVDNCFRVGGDEFVAVLTNVSEKDIKETLERFTFEQQRNDISIAVGYAYASDIGTTSFRKLFADADKNMYAEKIAMHNRK